MDVNKLADKIKELSNWEHRIFYYGQMPVEDAKAIIAKHHINSSDLIPLPEKKEYPELATSVNKVFYAPYDMQQVEMFFLSKDEVFNPEILAASRLFNEYFGSGLSSIVFQEIREKKALAYSAYSYISSPSDKDKSHYLNAYIGTQADKLSDATEAMFALMNDMPEAEMQFNAAKEAVIKKLESDWVTGSDVYWQYESARDLGLDYDVNQNIYEEVKSMTLIDLKAFFDDHIKGKSYHICVIGKKDNIDLNVLQSMGEFQELSLEEIFGY